MMASDSASWNALHPASVFVNLLPRTWSVVKSMWPLFLIMLFGGRADGQSLFDAALLSVFMMLTIGGTVLHWWTLRYRIFEGRLEVQTGFLNRQTRVIAPDRIQNLETVSNVFHRITGLVEVRIETASGTEVEGLLSALSVAQADRLMNALEELRKGAVDSVPEEDLPIVAQNGLMDLFRFGATATRLGAALVVVGFLFEGQRRLDTGIDLITDLGWPGFALGMVAILTGTWLLGTGRAVVRHYGFTMVHTASSLIATEGLLTRRRVELPRDKVQLVVVSEPLLRRWAGFGSVHIETAAARAEGGGIQNAEAVIPVVETRQLYEVVRHAVPALDVDIEGLTLRPPAPMALVRELIAASWQATVFGGAVSWWFWPWGLLALMTLPLGWIAVWLDHRHQGWLVTDEVIVARQGFLSRKTRIVARAKLQSSEVSQGLFLRRYSLGRLAVRVAGNVVALPIVQMDEALDIQQALLR
jgi:putative membrane protein